MSTHSPWRPAQQRAMAESPKVREELESPPRRWPMTLLAVVALLIGLGLGNAFGTSGRDLRATGAELETRTAELQAARADAERIRSAYDHVRVLLASERRAGAVSDEGSRDSPGRRRCSPDTRFHRRDPGQRRQGSWVSGWTCAAPRT